MKLPTSPPELNVAGPDGEPELSDLEAALQLRRPEVQEFVRRANRAYWHWDQLRRRPPVAGYTARQLWFAVKFSRQADARPFGLTTPGGTAFTYWLPEHAQEALHEIDLCGGGHIGMDLPAATETARERFVVNSQMEEAIASSQLEGAATTRAVAKKMLREERPPRTRGEQMILNNYRTMRQVAEWKSTPLSLELLLRMQEMIADQTLDEPSEIGRLRTSADQIQIVDQRDNAVVYVPPSAELLTERLRRLIDFANEDNAVRFIHPVIRAILLHFWLAYEHPFVDGNGRTARAVLYWRMIRSGYWLFEFLPISRIINRAPIRYGRANLYAEHDDCDATYFIMFHLRAIRHAMRDLKAYLQAEQLEAQAAQLRTQALRGLNERQIRLLDRLARRREATITLRHYQNENVISYGTAHNDLSQLVRRRILARTRSGRTIVFRLATKTMERLLAGKKLG